MRLYLIWKTPENEQAKIKKNDTTIHRTSSSTAYLSEESEEGEEEDEEIEAEVEVDTAEDQHVQPQLQTSSPLRKKPQRYQLPAEQLDGFDKHSAKEERAPRFENGNQCNWKVFRAAHKIYREEQKGS